MTAAATRPSAAPSRAGRTAAEWVLVSADFHYRGGQGRANAALAEHLLARGASLRLVAHDVDPRLGGHPAVVVRRAPRLPGGAFLGGWWLHRLGRAVARRACADRPGTRVLVNGGGCSWPDLNWVHYVHAAWRPRVAGAPLWFRIKDAALRTVYRRREREALTSARLVLANSLRTRDELIGRLGLDPGRVHNVYLGSDPAWRPPSAGERAAARAWLGQPDGRPLAVFVGGLGHDHRKGFDTLWEAWSRLCPRPDWDADLVVAGGGSGSALWRRRVGAAGLGRRVRFLGFTDRVFELLAAADLLVSPVRYEPYGLNVQEAVCRGVPALVSACAGAAEQYPPELAGMVLPDPDDAGALARMLVAWRADVAGWRARFRPLSDALRAYTWDDMAARIVALAEAPVSEEG